MVGNEAIGLERIQSRVIFRSIGSYAEPFRTPFEKRACRIDRHYDIDRIQTHEITISKFGDVFPMYAISIR